LARLWSGAELAGQLGLGLNAGHGLTYENVGPVAALPGLQDLNIGHNIVARAVIVGMEKAVREMISAMKKGQTMNSTEIRQSFLDFFKAKATRSSRRPR